MRNDLINKVLHAVLIVVMMIFSSCASTPLLPSPPPSSPPPSPSPVLNKIPTVDIDCDGNSVVVVSHENTFRLGGEKLHGFISYINDRCYLFLASKRPEKDVFTRRSADFKSKDAFSFDEKKGCICKDGIYELSEGMLIKDDSLTHPHSNPLSQP